MRHSVSIHDIGYIADFIMYGVFVRRLLHGSRHDTTSLAWRKSNFPGTFRPAASSITLPSTCGVHPRAARQDKGVGGWAKKDSGAPDEAATWSCSCQVRPLARRQCNFSGTFQPPTSCLTLPSTCGVHPRAARQDKGVGGGVNISAPSASFRRMWRCRGTEHGVIPKIRSYMYVYIYIYTNKFTENQ